MTVTYTIVEARDATSLIERVTACLEDGWMCAGGLATANTPGVYFYQAMTRNPPHDHESRRISPLS